MFRRLQRTLAACFCLTLISATAPTPASAPAEPAASAVERGLERLQTATDGSTRIERSRATGAARIAVFEPGKITLVGPKAQADVPEVRAREFFRQFGAAFGVRDADAELRLIDTARDTIGATHVRFEQSYRGLPVFGTMLRVHYDAAGRLTVVNGSFIPDIDVAAEPRLSVEAATRIARDDVTLRHGRATLGIRDSRLLVFRANLARAVPGANHLAWEIEVEGQDVGERVYVDALKGGVIDRIDVIHSLDRRIYEGGFEPVNLVWSEGDAQPYGDPDVDNLIDFTEDSYNLFSSMSNETYLSYDGLGHTMHAVHDSPNINCPNASWVGDRTIYCPGVTADDTVAHEWGHAYTSFTHGLIYQWQPGALNESYSDIWGEVVDFINGAGTDAPIERRATGECSTYGGSPLPSFEVTAPAELAGLYEVGGATFNPVPITVSGTVELVDDGNAENDLGSVTDACQVPIGFTAGNIALVDRGRCSSTQKVLNAQSAGAVAVIIVNTTEDIGRLGGSNGGIDVPTVYMALRHGELFKAAGSFDVTIATSAATDPSLRWLAGEDDPGFGGAIRDMWNPECYVDGGKVTSGSYKCAESDNGGVHSNSGVPNHAFALAVDGGLFDGQLLSGIGLTKAAHIYWRAQSVYQVPTTIFEEHADMLEQSCADLIGQPLYVLSTDSPVGVVSPETITQADCDQLANVMAVTEMRVEPTQCNFVPLLLPDPPPICDLATPEVVTSVDWESGLADWTVGTRDVVNPATFDTPDWALVSDLPGDRPGTAAFVANLVIGNCSDDIEAGVLFLESPAITVPAGATDLSLTFDHWVAVEPRWDGANVKVSVNGGAFAVVPPEDFLFNPYPEDVLATGDNPMSGEPAFYGTDGGSLTGSWGQSQVDLSGYSTPGDEIRLRFEMGLDGCNGRIGWYVDEVRLQSCLLGCVEVAWYPDADLDGFGTGEAVISCDPPPGTSENTGDCNDTDSTIWSRPGEVMDLFVGPDADTFFWSPPMEPGADAIAYDVLRSDQAADFIAGGRCADVATPHSTWVEDQQPPLGSVWFYLVRADNACPGAVGTLGQDTFGTERRGPNCGPGTR